MEMKFSDEDISTFYKQLIELGGVQTVDESPDKYVRKKDDNSIAYITNADKSTKQVAVYGTRASDAMILNPLAEGDADSALTSWFMKNCNLILAANIAKIIKTCLTYGAETHQKKADKDDGADPKGLLIAKYLSKDIADVDEKMVKEFDSICKPITNFFNIHYNRSTMKGEVKCPIFTLAQRKSMPKIRVKTWEVLEHLAGRILGTDTLDVFAYQPGTVGVPVFESFANILVKLYEVLTEPLKIIDVEVKRIPELQSHLKYLPQYYAKAKWCVTPQTPTSGSNSGTVPWAQSSVQSQISPQVQQIQPVGAPAFRTVSAVAPVPVTPSVPVPMPMPMGSPTIPTMPMMNNGLTQIAPVMPITPKGPGVF